MRKVENTTFRYKQAMKALKSVAAPSKTCKSYTHSQALTSSAKL